MCDWSERTVLMSFIVWMLARPRRSNGAASTDSFWPLCSISVCLSIVTVRKRSAFLFIRSDRCVERLAKRSADEIWFLPAPLHSLRHPPSSNVLLLLLHVVFDEETDQSNQRAVLRCTGGGSVRLRPFVSLHVRLALLPFPFDPIDLQKTKDQHSTANLSSAIVFLPHRSATIRHPMDSFLMSKSRQEPTLSLRLSVVFTSVRSIVRRRRLVNDLPSKTWRDEIVCRSLSFRSFGEISSLR